MLQPTFLPKNLQLMHVSKVRSRGPVKQVEQHTAVIVSRINRKNDGVTISTGESYSAWVYLTFFALFLLSLVLSFWLLVFSLTSNFTFPIFCHLKSHSQKRYLHSKKVTTIGNVLFINDIAIRSIHILSFFLNPILLCKAPVCSLLYPVLAGWVLQTWLFYFPHTFKIYILFFFLLFFLVSIFFLWQAFFQQDILILTWLRIFLVVSNFVQYPSIF